MNRIYSEVKITDDITRYRVKLEDFPSQEGTKDSETRRLQILQTLADTPHVGACGPSPFKKMQMYHDGEKWVVELEATIKQSAI